MTNKFKRFLGIFIVVLLAFMFVPKTLAQGNGDDVEVNISATLDGDDQNITLASGSYEYGSSFKASFTEAEGEFALWIIDGVARTDVEKDDFLVATNDLNAIAVFLDEGSTLDLYIDHNGKHLGSNYYDNPTFEVPVVDKIGYTFEGWETEVVKGVNIKRALYEVDHPDVKVNGDFYTYNRVLMLDLEGDVWVKDGKVVSYNDQYVFSTLKEETSLIRRELEEGEELKDIVSLEVLEGYRNNYTTYLAQVEIIDGTIVEWGLEADGVLKKASSIHPLTNEFLISTQEDYKVVRAYAVVKGGEDFDYVYSEYIINTPSIAEIREVAKGKKVNFVGVVSGFTNPKGQVYESVWLEDETGSIPIYSLEYDKELEIGSRYLIKAIKDEYYGLIQVKSAEVIKYMDAGHELIEATNVTELPILESLMSKRINLEAEVVSVDSTGRNLTVKIEDKTITARLESNEATDDLNQLFLTALEGQNVQFINTHVGWFNGAQLYPVSISQVIFDLSNVVEVEFNTDSGSQIESIRVLKGNAIDKPKNPTKDDALFRGWFTDEELSNSYDFEEPVTSSITLYAKWVDKQYTITYNLNEGAFSNEFFAQARNAMIVEFLTDFYNFLGIEDITLEEFMHGEGNTSGYDGTYNSAENFAKLYAANKKDVDADSGLFINQPEYNQKWLFLLELMEDYTKSNPDQSFWASPTGVGIYRIKPFFQQRNLWSSWIDLDAFEIVINAVHDRYMPYSFTVSSEDLVLPIPVKEGFTFVGWFNNPEFTGEEITSIPQGSTGNITLYAKFNSITDFLVDSSITAEEGTKITVNEIEFIVGVSAFKTLEELAGLFGENVNIYVAAGTYSGDLVINKNGVTLLGNNALISGNAEERNAETILTGKITLAKELEDITISGFKFTGMAQILNTKGTAGTSSVPTINLNGFTFENNIVETALASGNGFIIFEEAGSSYSHNLEFVNNFFTTTDEETTLANVIYIDNNAGLTFTGNVFKDVINGAFYVHDSTKGLAGNTLISENTFENVGNGAILIGWLSALPGTTMGVEISKNEFTNVGGIALKLGSMNNTDVFTFINVKENEFTDCDACMWFNRVHAGANYHVNDNVFNTVPENYYITDAKSAATPIALDATNNIYKDNGEVITPDPEKFVGSPNL